MVSNNRDGDEMRHDLGAVVVVAVEYCLPRWLRYDVRPTRVCLMLRRGWRCDGAETRVGRRRRVSPRRLCVVP